MAKDPAFLFYPGDYLRDTQVLSEPVQVSYDRIMCEHMRNICISKSQLNFLTKKLSAEEKSELLSVLTEVQGGFQIHWVAESISKRKAYNESRRSNRKGKKEKHMKIISATYDSHMENENEIPIVLKNKKELLSDQIFHEQVCMALGIDMPIMLEKLNQFVNEKSIGGELQKSLNECRTHFRNWLKIEIKKDPENKPKKKKGVVI